MSLYLFSDIFPLGCWYDDEEGPQLLEDLEGLSPYLDGDYWAREDAILVCNCTMFILQMLIPSIAIFSIFICHSNKDICELHRWEGEMISSQHKSPHQARDFRRGLDVVMSADISPSSHTQRCSLHFSFEYVSETAKSN